MLKEIPSSPPPCASPCRGGRPAQRTIRARGIDYARKLANAKRVVFVGQGTALHAAMIEEFLVENLAKIPLEVEFASEFRYRNPIVEPGTVIAISQSGDRRRSPRSRRRSRRCVDPRPVNVVGSTISRNGCRHLSPRGPDRGRFDQGLHRAVAGDDPQQRRHRPATLCRGGPASHGRHGPDSGRSGGSTGKSRRRPVAT